MRVLRDLNSIGCVANDQFLLSLGFNPGYVFSMRLQNLSQEVSATGATDDLSKQWAIQTTLHYLRALLDSGPEALSEVRDRLRSLPKIRERGYQMYSMIEGRNLQDRDQRLRALMLMRNTLGLSGRVDILEYVGETVIRH